MRGAGRAPPARCDEAGSGPRGKTGPGARPGRRGGDGRLDLHAVECPVSREDGSPVGPGPWGPTGSWLLAAWLRAAVAAQPVCTLAPLPRLLLALPWAVCSLGWRARPAPLGGRPSWPLAGWQPALVWSAPHLQGGGDAGKQVQLPPCIRPLEWEPRFPGPDGIRAHLTSSPGRPRIGPVRAQDRGSNDFPPKLVGVVTIYPPQIGGDNRLAVVYGCRVAPRARVSATYRSREGGPEDATWNMA